jgi:PAS domain S-box-containing protein
VLLRADGSTLTVRHSVVPIAGTAANGAPAVHYVMSIISDWTEQARAESALRETEARFRQLAENIDELVFVADMSLQHIQYVNARLEALVGIDHDTLIQAPARVLDLVHPQALPEMRRRLPRVLAALRRVRKVAFDVRIQHPIQGERVLQVRMNPVKLPDGTVRVFGMAEDITERVASERERAAAAAAERDVLVRELHRRIKTNLQGVATLVQKVAADHPDTAETLLQTASQIEAIAQVHGLQLQALAALPAVSVVQGIVASLAARFGVDIRYEVPAPALWRWGLPEQEAVAVALIVNELVVNALRHRSAPEQPVLVRVLPRGEGLDIRIENSGTLPEDFDLAGIGQGAQGLPLVKSLLPRRGARLSMVPIAGGVLTRLELAKPALREESTA